MLQYKKHKKNETQWRLTIILMVIRYEGAIVEAVFAKSVTQ